MKNRQFLGNRIEIYYTLSILVIILLMMGCFYAVGKAFVVDERTETLKDATARTMEHITLTDGQLEVDNDVQFSSDGAYVVLIDAEGSIIDGALADAFTGDVPLQDGQVQLVREDGEKYYIYDKAISEIEQTEAPKTGKDTSEQKVQYWLRGVTSGEFTEMVPSIAGTVRTMTMLIPFLILGILIAGWLVTRRALTPLRQITETAELIQKEGDLSRRIGVKSHGRWDEIRHTAEVFDGMLEQIEKNFEREKRFTDDAGHELRTPVAVIMAECEYSMENLDDPVELETSLHSILSESRHMSNLISELLMIARADRGALEFNWEKVDLSLLAEECCDRIRQPADQRSIRVRVMAKEGIYAECDRLLMGKALDNLLTNAVKYGRDGGFVRVSVEEQGSDAVRITVEDDGIGIPQKEQERIWDRFYRAENAKAFLGTGGEDESMGLGLAFVRWVATAHGGKVICESVQGQGSRFLLTIPLMHV